MLWVFSSFQTCTGWEIKNAGGAGWNGLQGNAVWCVQGRSRQDFSNSCKCQAGLNIAGAEKSSTRAGIHSRNTAAPKKLSAGQWCWNYISLVNISPVANTFQLKFQRSSTDIFIIVVPLPMTGVAKLQLFEPLHAALRAFLKNCSLSQECECQAVSAILLRVNAWCIYNGYSITSDTPETLDESTLSFEDEIRKTRAMELAFKNSEANHELLLVVQSW